MSRMSQPPTSRTGRCSKMIITLCGFMGSGKTTVGRVLADFLGCPFIDLDDAVEQKAAKPIKALFTLYGEAAFRQMEAAILRQTVEKYGENTVVIALGGGSVTTPASALLLRERTVCIYLKTSLEAVRQRLEGETEGRPLADDRLSERFAEREPIYEKTAHVIVDTDGLSPEDVADEIVISCL